MKLNLKQIQAVDILLQKLNSNYHYVPNTQQLNLVIKIDNSLWKGNLIQYKDYRIYNYYIDYDSLIESYGYSQNQIFNLPNDFNLKKYASIKLDTMYLLLEELISIVKKIDTYLIDLTPILFNAVNLKDNFQLPYFLLNPNDEFEIVSVISTTIDECTHS